MAMPLRTRLFTTLIGLRDRTPLSDRTLAQIQASRRIEPPHAFPLSLVFGSVPRTVSRRDEQVPTRAGQVLVRHYEPAGRAASSPVVVFFHGGGWVQGSVPGYDALCAQTASRTGSLVLSVDYRLAPEHVFPAAVEDCLVVTTWVIDSADRLRVDPSRLAVMGDSAGGNLAAVVSQQLRDLGGVVPACQVLIYPATDATFASPSIDENADAPVLTRRSMHDFVDRYHPDGDRRDPRLSPLFAADLSGLPPTLVQTAQLDPLRDDGSRYADALVAAGVPVRYTEYAGMPHGFASFPGVAPCGEQHLAEIAATLTAAFSGQRVR
jgi:acetyl esterase